MNDNRFFDLAYNTIRFLAVDATNTAKSGHPGSPMGEAVIAWSLWMNHMRYNPKNPNWLNRDRFVLSSGHSCLLQYAMLYLTGYNITLDDIKNFRQLHSITPGHPEYGITPGIETTTGPLGQGFATAVGMAMAERNISKYLNSNEHKIIDYNTYILCGDGDMMEGITSEAASIAGHLGLNKLICIYSDNHISIEGNTNITFSENVGKRFESYGWFVQSADGNDLNQIDNAINIAKKQTDKPALIHLQTNIGYGSPSKQDTKEAHGEPLGIDEAKRTKEKLGWPVEPMFYVPEEIYTCTQKKIEIGYELEEKWNDAIKQYKSGNKEACEKLDKIFNSKITQQDIEKLIYPATPEDGISSREASGNYLNSIANSLEFLVGGSADLSPSTKTYLKGFPDMNYKTSGRNIHFGVREHAMGAILNGFALTKPFIPFGGTFLIFSDYMRPSIRLASIMRLQIIYIFSHDSFMLGEDGTTHQPIEQLQSLRAIPNLMVIRPADARETYEAWNTALIHNDRPSALILSRQKLESIPRIEENDNNNVLKGGYIIWQNSDNKPDLILIASGSEVSLCIKAAKLLAENNLTVRVVSMPCTELFDAQSIEYKYSILPPDVSMRIAVEAGSPDGWWKYTGLQGDVVGMAQFGTSAPMADLKNLYGFIPEKIAEKAKKLLTM